MPKAIIIIAILVLPFATLAQRNINLGMGVINFAFEKQPTLLFYADTTQAKPAQTITVTKSKTGDPTIENENQIITWLKPEGLWPDYSIFVLRVDTIIGRWYRVYADNNKGTRLWLKATAATNFVNWQKFLVEQTTVIDKHKDFQLDVKASPSETAPTIKRMESSDCFEAIEIKGDWLHIRTNTMLDCDEGKKTIKSGWIKWRQNNRLTIGYGLTC